MMRRRRARGDKTSGVAADACVPFERSIAVRGCARARSQSCECAVITGWQAAARNAELRRSAAWGAADSEMTTQTPGIRARHPSVVRLPVHSPSAFIPPLSVELARSLACQRCAADSPHARLHHRPRVEP